GEQRRVEVDLEKPTSLPASPVEARLPLASVTETLNLGVEVLTQRVEGGPAVLATGQTTAEVSAQAKKTELTISLSLNPDFDWDLDGDPDLHDCEPDDPNVLHGAVDVCDGVRTACEDFCFIPLEDAHFVRDLACATVERKCAAVIEGPSSSVVRIYDPDLGSDPVQLDGVTKARGLAWTKSGSEEHLMVAEDWQIHLASSSGEGAGVALSSVEKLSGNIVVSRHGSIAVAPLARPLMLQVFDPRAMRASANDLACDTPNSSCTTLTGSDLSSTLGPISLDARILEAEVYQPVDGGLAGVYISFDKDERVGLASVNSDRQLQEHASGYISLDAGVRRVASFGLSTKLLLVAGDDSQG